MKTLVSIAALALAIAFAAPAFAGPPAPTNQADCKKAGMHWDDATKTCHKGKM